MKVCLVNDSFTGKGGANRVIIQVANLLNDNGYDVTLVDFSGKNKFDYEINPNIRTPQAIKKRLFRREIVKGFMYLKNIITKESINVYSLFREQTDDLIYFLEQNDFDNIILCQGVLTALLPYIKSEKKSAKYIAWQHNEYEIYVNNYYKRFLNDYVKGIRVADAIVCLTEEDLSKIKMINKNSLCIYNPLTIGNKNNIISNLKNKKIVFVGRLVLKQKGLDTLISIAKQINDDWKIVVAGDGPDKDNFIQLIKENKLENKIILKGNLNDDQLNKLYSSGSIFISTSRWEGFGLVLTEAMSFGLPVISFNTNGPKEILDNGRYGILIEKNNVSDFAEKLNLLIDNYSIRKQYQTLSLERVKDFNEETIFKKWQTLIG